MFANCAAAVARASRELSQARDWLIASSSEEPDWSTECSSLTPVAAQTRQSVLTGIAESKALIEGMQQEISAARQRIKDES